MFQKLPLPSPQFNHAIIYLPAYNIFANPTDKHAAFGELGTYLNGKFVAIATEKGMTAYTPSSVALENLYLLKSTANISLDGTINGESELKFSGNLNSNMRSYFASDSLSQIAHQLLSMTAEGGTGFLEKSDLSNLNQPLTIKGKWTSPYGVDIDKKIYFTTPTGFNIYNPQHLRSYITPGKRLYPAVIGAANYIWESKILLPPGYKIDRLPESRTFSNAAGKYISSYEKGQGYVLVKRNLIINNTVYSPEEYPAFKELIYKPINDARSVMVLDKL
jgi:hypothetical protein